MQEHDIDFDAILSRYRADPFAYREVRTAHTGRLRCKVREGDEVVGPSGKFRHIPGTLLYELERERNLKPITSLINGQVAMLRSDLEGSFVESGEHVLTIRHPLKKREIVEDILRQVLTPYTAPEKAKYFFSLELQSRIDKYGQRSVSIKPGDEILTMSLMKRDTPVYYDGEPGIIHSVYFKPGVSVDQGEPLFGVCPKEKLPLIEKIITRVKAEWE
ncbi:hypothetical protein [Desulfurivibrio alkaliphilus]|uniref:Biotin/lipoyl attachment domain-containing protein n=1 Tax=Desulfurivibrio alkaliphilus (strain DSM 19089 / UNIQEM U267 / AHT2) TaxID=589865 RepID=D6Z011_DESAT|nr:hypothetical protein [Desulfurivibrio alkaliphilus]ADH85168.1 conserved hypothetical protein [Desulfurivibrio alkaliphilus AHT 2]